MIINSLSFKAGYTENTTGAVLVFIGIQPTACGENDGCHSVDGVFL